MHIFCTFQHIFPPSVVYFLQNKEWCIPAIIHAACGRTTLKAKLKIKCILKWIVRYPELSHCVPGTKAKGFPIWKNSLWGIIRIIKPCRLYQKKPEISRVFLSPLLLLRIVCRMLIAMRDETDGFGDYTQGKSSALPKMC